MRRTKEEMGITLIALIMTIVVLLILAIIAINSIQDDGLIIKSEEVTNIWNKVEKNELITLGGHASFINQYISNSDSTSKITWKN